MKLGILLLYLHVAMVIAQGRNITCSVPIVEPLQDTVLTCNFPEDLNVTRKDFLVYHYNKGENSDAVLDCWWFGGSMECFQSPNVRYNRIVSKTLNLTLRRVTSNHTGIYACQVAGYDPSYFKTCDLQIKIARVEITQADDQSVHSLAVGLSVGVPLGVLVAVLVILGYKGYKGRIRCRIFKRESRLAQPDVEEGQQLLDIEETTRMFQEYIGEQVKRMYPDTFESHYFVPPVYFNNTRYKTQSVAGQVVYVPDPCDPSVVYHDRAMQHVLHCLHRLAELDSERMFVLTQFQYDDYLNNPGNKYEQHRLPVPSGLKDVDKQVGCFDLLVVHRVHGVLAGVVKSVGNMENQDDEETTDKRIAAQVTEAVQQLRKAEQMLKHLMSDGCSLTKVGLTLILPNLTRSSLRNAVERHKDLFESLRWCLGEDPILLSVCAEDLSDPRKPWEVSNEVINKILSCWKWLIHRTDETASMNDDLYLKLISRFFGPATRSALQVPGEYERFILPKTHSQAVSLTGDLYGCLMLPPETTDILQRHKLFISGPPNSGKTVMLALAASHWLSQGHDVYCVNDISSKCCPFLSNQLKSLTESQGKEIASESTFGCTHDFQCDFATDKSMIQSIQRIVSEKNGKSLCILLDGAHLDGKRVKNFCEALDAEVSDLHLWVTCIDTKYLPAGYPIVLTTIHSCPPAVLREVTEAKVLVNTNENTSEAGLYPYPTDGPAVKHFFLNRSSEARVLSGDFMECGKEVGKFLAKLLTAATDECNKETYINELTSKEVMMETFPNAKPFLTAVSPLQFSDILILFEFSKVLLVQGEDVEEDHIFLKGLRESGITVRAVRTDGDKVVVMDDSNTAWAMHIRHMETFRVRRKIIVYVETGKKVKNVENKRRALTSCTSQLVLVHSKQV